MLDDLNININMKNTLDSCDYMLIIQTKLKNNNSNRARNNRDKNNHINKINSL